MRLFSYTLVGALLLLLAGGCTAMGESPADVPPTTPQVAAANTAVPDNGEREPQPTVAAPQLPDLGPAPEWQNETWINVQEPLTLPELRGKVVLLEFWTFG